MLKTLLIIDDEALFCDALKDHFAGVMNVLIAHSGADGLDLCAQRVVDVVLLDQNLPDGEGHTFCQAILKRNEKTKIVFVTAYPNFKHAVNAMQAGAFDYLSKPVELEELDIVLQKALRTIDLEKIELLHTYQSGREQTEPFISGGGLAPLSRLIDLAAQSEAPILITGETGTGKNALAQYIHERSPFRREPFLAINCAALPENLIEAELFGYEKGSFTGAVSSRKGIFEMASGGTLVLDEIGEMPIGLQSKLLGVLDSKQIKKIGDDALRPVNVRIMAITNTHIDESMRMKTFRADLYYRLSVIQIHMPPLRERLADIPALCRHLLKKITPAETSICDEEMQGLMGYHWPGNIRELKNILERAVLLRDGPRLSTLEFLARKDCSSEQLLRDSSLPPHIQTMGELEKAHITRALRETKENYRDTARMLGISLSTLKRRIKEYAIPKQNSG